MRTNISELGHNCKELTQLFFIYMSEIFAYLALQAERKEKVHLGERAKRQSVYQNPKWNVVIGISLVGYVECCVVRVSFCSSYTNRSMPCWCFRT